MKLSNDRIVLVNKNVPRFEFKLKLVLLKKISTLPVAPCTGKCYYKVKSQSPER